MHTFDFIIKTNFALDSVRGLWRLLRSAGRRGPRWILISRVVSGSLSARAIVSVSSLRRYRSHGELVPSSVSISIFVSISTSIVVSISISIFISISLPLSVSVSVSISISIYIPVSISDSISIPISVPISVSSSFTFDAGGLGGTAGSGRCFYATGRSASRGRALGGPGLYHGFHKIGWKIPISYTHATPNNYNV